MNAQDWLLRLRDIGWPVLSIWIPIAPPFLLAPRTRNIRLDIDSPNSSRLASGGCVWLRSEP